MRSHEILRLTIRRDIERFYNAAAEPFETTLRKIEAGEEPFAPRRAPEDYDAPNTNTKEARPTNAWESWGIAVSYSLTKPSTIHKGIRRT